MLGTWDITELFLQFGRCKIKAVFKYIFGGKLLFSVLLEGLEKCTDVPTYLVVHNVSDCPIITTLWKRERERRDFLNSIKSFGLFTVRSLAAIIFFWRSGMKNKLPSLNRLFFPVLLNRAVFLDVLWPLRMSQPKHPAVRWSALFVPGGVYSFTVVRWWKNEQDSVCQIHLNRNRQYGLTGKKVHYSQISFVWMTREIRWLTVVLLPDVACVNHAIEIIQRGFWQLTGTNLEQKIDSKTMRKCVCFGKLKVAGGS